MIIQNPAKDKGLHKIKNRIRFKSLRKLLSQKSYKTYNLKLLDRWNYLKNRKKILDAGCGSGDFMKLNPFGVEIIGRDLNKNKLSELKEQGLNVDFADLNENFKFKDNSFDAVSSFNVFEHLKDPENTIREFHRVLKKDGLLFLIVPNLSFKKFHHDYTHQRLFTEISLYNILKDNGFSRILIRRGPLLTSSLLNVLFLFFPTMRWNLEKFMGKFFPSEIFALAKK